MVLRLHLKELKPDMKSLTLNHKDIEQACERFRLPIEEPWFELESNVIWMHWVCSPEDIEWICRRELDECVFVRLDGNWQVLEEIDEITALIEDKSLIATRYIVDAI